MRRRRIVAISAIVSFAITAILLSASPARSEQNVAVEGHTWDLCVDIARPLDGVELFVYDNQDALLWEGESGAPDRPECYEDISGFFSNWPGWSTRFVRDHTPFTVVAVYNNREQETTVEYEDFYSVSNGCNRDVYLAVELDFIFIRCAPPRPVFRKKLDANIGSGSHTLNLYPAHIWGVVRCDNGVLKKNVEVHAYGYFSTTQGWVLEERTDTTDTSGTYIFPYTCNGGPECPGNYYEITIPAYNLEEDIYADEGSEEVDFTLPVACISITRLPSLY